MLNIHYIISTARCSHAVDIYMHCIECSFEIPYCTCTTSIPFLYSQLMGIKASFSLHIASCLWCNVQHNWSPAIVVLVSTYSCHCTSMHGKVDIHTAGTLQNQLPGSLSPDVELHPSGVLFLWLAWNNEHSFCWLQPFSYMVLMNTESH